MWHKIKPDSEKPTTKGAQAMTADHDAVAEAALELKDTLISPTMEVLGQTAQTGVRVPMQDATHDNPLSKPEDKVFARQTLKQ